MNDDGMIRDASSSDTIEPTPLQHTTVRAICTMMHAALPTDHGKEVVLATLASTAHVDEGWDKFRHGFALGEQCRARHGPRRRPNRPERRGGLSGVHRRDDHTVKEHSDE